MLRLRLGLPSLRTCRIHCVPCSVRSIQWLATSRFRKTELYPLSSTSTLTGAIRHRSNFPQPKLKKCPSCSAPLPTPLIVCPACNHVEPIPNDMSYHDVMGVDYDPNPFNVNPAMLRSRFIALQSLVHPDKWAGKPPAKADTAARISETVNVIHGTLSDPVLRIAYILEREGVTRNQEAILDDPEVVMEIMEVREALEQAETEEEMERIRRENSVKLAQTVEDLSNLVGQKTWDLVTPVATRLKYLQVIENAAKAWPNSVHDH